MIKSKIDLNNFLIRNHVVNTLGSVGHMVHIVTNELS